MPKMKTRKAVTKRVKVKKNKVMAMAKGQNHFNGKQSGDERRSKTKDTGLTVNRQDLKRSINQ